MAFAPYLVNKMGKKWHIAYADYSWGQSTKDAYAEQIKKAGGEVVGTTGIPLGTADMTPFLSKITGDFDGFFGIFFGKDGVTIGNQAYDLGLTKKYKWAGDGAIAESTNLPALGNKIEGFVGINRYIPVFDRRSTRRQHKKFFDEAVKRLKEIDPSGPLPDRYVQSNYEAMNALKLGMEKSRFQRPRGHHETDRGARRAGDEGRRRLPAGRQGAAQGGSPGVPARVHLRDQGRQAPHPRGDPEGKDDLPAGLHVRLSCTCRARPLTARFPGRRAGGGATGAHPRTEGLTVRFGGLTALNNVNFEVQRGEIRAIIGPNGAGKSTFFNCLTGVLRPTSGRIVFNGDDITGLPPNRISQKGIARSYQITNILPNATTLENVRIAAQSRRHGWSMLTHHRDFHDLIDKAEAVLAVGRARRQGRRAGRQPFARRTAQPRDRHRARHRAASCCASTSRPPA